MRRPRVAAPRATVCPLGRKSWLSLVTAREAHLCGDRGWPRHGQRFVLWDESEGKGAYGLPRAFHALAMTRIT